MKYIATVHDQEFTIDVNREDEVTIDGTTYAVDIQGMNGDSLYSLIIDGRSYDVFIDEQDEDFLVVMWNGLFEVRVQDERTRRLAGLRRGPVAPVGAPSMAIWATGRLPPGRIWTRFTTAIPMTSLRPSMRCVGTPSPANSMLP